MSRLLVIGLDGATFDLITPWVRERKLPHLANLLTNSIHGELKSTIPPMSPPAWTSFMTGKNPGKHGIFDFTARKPNSYEVEFVNARWRKAETIWKIMSDAGKRVCIIAVPMTYPPEKVNGIMISGIDTPGVTVGRLDSTAVYPSQLHREIQENIGEYVVAANYAAFKNNQCDEMVAAALQTIERKMEAAIYLFRKELWDCFMITIGETDAIAHRLWKVHDKNSPLCDDDLFQYRGVDPILRIYQGVDDYIGKLCSMVDDDTTILILSDHGHGGNASKVIYLNRWLEHQNLLTFRTPANTSLLPSICRKAISTNIDWAKTIAVKFLPANLKRELFRKSKLAHKMESWLRFSHIDWSHTKAYSEETPYYPSIWINLQGREPAGIVRPGREYEETREHIIYELSKWLDPETGQAIVRRVHKREEVYSGQFVEQFPDLIIDWNLAGNYSFLFKSSRNKTTQRTFFCRIDEEDKKSAKSGDHRDYGILIAFGKNLNRAVQLHGAEIIDLAPTILYLLGLPIPSDMDGKVLTRIFRDEYLTSHPLQSCERPGLDTHLTEPLREYSEEEREAVRARLQGLGYLE
jgi:predicted AlkP superfamily phosphohydrolase/phosphomutase